MKKTIANISLRGRLLAMVMPLTLAVLVLVGMAVADAWKARGAAHEARYVSEIAGLVGDVVHRLQVERGLSAAFLANPTAARRERVAEQYRESERAIKQLEAGVSGETGRGGIAQPLESATRETRRLSDIRRGVLDESARAGEVVAAYTRIVEALIGVVHASTEAMPSGVLASTTRTLGNLVSAQEAAGRERAALARAVASRDLPASLRDRAVSLASAQSVFVRLAYGDAPDGLSIEPSEARGQAVAALRARILNEDMAGISDADWWEASSANIEAMFEDQQTVTRHLRAVADAQLAEAWTALIAAVAAALVCAAALGVAWILAGDMRRRLHSLYRHVHEVERSSDLTRRTGLQSSDEIGGLATRLDRMLAKLSDALSNVSEAASQLAAPSEELSVVSSQLHDGTQRQQSETDQVASAMNEMSAAIQEVARHATDASSAASEGEDRAQEVDRQVEGVTGDITELATTVEQVAALMRSLDERAEQMSQVVEIIRGVTEQTNLLALNASIEAARAGEQGRGFAVVATEVRTLAQETNRSTENIRELISGLQAAANDGVAAAERGKDKVVTTREAATRAREALESITSTVARIAAMNDQIASATEQQSSAAEEINRNIVHICEISEETANGAKETSGASEELARVAARLQEQVQQFKV